MKGFLGRLKTRLGKKLGPLPLWAWAAGGLALAVWYVRRQSAATTPATATTAATDTSQTATPATPDTSGFGDISGYGSGSSGDLNPSNTIDPSAPAAPPATAPAVPGGGSATTTPGQTTPTPTATPTRTGSTAVPVTSGLPGSKSIVTEPNGKTVAESSVPAGWTAVPTGSGILNAATQVPEGARNVKVNKQTGVVSYIAANGSLIEQAPGKSRYVADKAGSPVAAQAAKPRTAAASGGARTSGGGTVKQPRQASAPTAEPVHVVAGGNSRTRLA